MSRLAALAFFALILPLAGSGQELPATIQTARELRALSPEQAAEKRPVRLRGIVTLLEPGRTIFPRPDSPAQPPAALREPG